MFGVAAAFVMVGGEGQLVWDRSAVPAGRG
jgi:hypothetical protein